MDVESFYSLPSPTGTPYRTPSSSRSRRSREYEDMSPAITPPPMPSNEKAVRRRSNDSSNTALDERLSPLDPRRFTPTLHASLVSEILTLRRDIEGKTKHIDQLEQSLHTSQLHTDSLNKTILTSNKEVRSVKRQMQLLEGGTLSAINDLSNERDEALNEATDLRKRLEQSQKKAKSQEGNVDRTQLFWDNEREAWAVEKRAMETKIHVVEGRLKVVLNEVAQTQFHLPEERGLFRSLSRRSRSGSPVKVTTIDFHDRRQSVTSVGSDHVGGRTSVLSFANGITTNLADELALEDIEEVEDHESNHAEGRISPDALPEERGRPASSLSIKARKILGLPFDIENMERGNSLHVAGDAIMWEGLAVKPVFKSTDYVDAAVQYSPPSSPMLKVSNSFDDHKLTQQILESSSAGSTANMGEELWNKSVTLPRPAMVSCSCQTADALLSPPLTPQQNDKFLATIPESAYERIETKEMATQTETSSSSANLPCYVHSRTGTHDLAIPTIAIIPPGSRSVTPENNVVLPPRTKSMSCQVDLGPLLRYTSTAMQTEEIRVDRRNIFSPHLMPGALVSSQIQAATSKGKVSACPRRTQQPNQTISNSGMKRTALPVPSLPPLNDDGPLAMDYAVDRTRPIRSSSLFAGFDDQIEELDDDFGEDVFEDDDSSNKPTSKFILRSGKLISHQKSLEDISEITAATAGEVLALEMLRQGEDSLPQDLRRADSIQREKSLSRTSTIRRGASSARPNSMRRVAMISNGTAAHQSKHSQSTNDSFPEVTGAPPPMPIPLRYSSARIGKSFSEGGRNSRGSSNTSPTRQARHRTKPVLRKSKSGPALSPANSALRRQRSTSPPYDARISIVPDMPNFEMPGPARSVAPRDLVNTPQEASAPRPSVATGPSRSHHTKSDSNAGALQQTSVVDAIAQTMVGEWMYKYVRRRKSFGKPDKDWDPNKSADELINNPSSAGVRHKRWVWVAPYERAVMWSSKQPTNGTALLGKSGRKLTIKSVLDVNDDNPMPKNSLTGPQFNRSILILTPQRALKFTATSQERHYTWLTALSFLSHSPVSIGDLAALPPLPGLDGLNAASPPPSILGPSRRRIRDSIRMAKGPSRQTATGRSFTTDGSVLGSDRDYPADTRPATRDTYSTVNDAALPPIIKRYHNRQRSNTAPKAPSSAFRSFSYRDAVPPASSSNYTQSIGMTDRGSSDRGQLSPSLGNPSIPSSRRGSEASALGRPNHSMNFVSSSFFDSNSSHNATMTMRMDAFIENKQAGKGGFRNLRLGQNSNAVGGTKSNDQRGDMAFWGLDNSLPSVSPVNSLTPVESSLRYSGSTGRGSVERDFFRGF